MLTSSCFSKKVSPKGVVAHLSPLLVGVNLHVFYSELHTFIGPRDGVGVGGWRNNISMISGCFPTLLWVLSFSFIKGCAASVSFSIHICLEDH